MFTMILSLPGVIIIDILSSLPAEVYIVVLLLVMLLIASYMLPSWFGKSGSRLTVNERRRLSTIHLEPRSVMSPDEALLYNTLHMVVRDRYLLLAKVPFRNLIQMTEIDKVARRALFHATRNVIVDFVFVHPGSLITEKVLFVKTSGEQGQLSRFPEVSMLDLISRAQIEVAHLMAGRSYTMEELAEILELGAEE